MWGGRGIERMMDRTVHRMSGRNEGHARINYRTKISVYWARIVWSRTNIIGVS